MIVYLLKSLLIENVNIIKYFIIMYDNTNKTNRTTKYYFLISG